jgi:replicative DNA helicase
LDESQLLAAMLQDRKAYDRLAGKLDPNDFSEYGQLVVRAVVQFYKRDPAASRVDRDVVSSTIARLYPSPKQSSAALEYLASIPGEVSTENVTTEYRLLRRRRIGLDLAAALGDKNPQDDRVDRLIDRYQELSRDAVTNSVRPSMEALEQRTGKRWKLSPALLNDELGGGLLRGDHIVIFGRPNAGKSMFAINQACSLLKQGAKVLYVCNEESDVRYLPRFISRLAGGGAYTWSAIEADPSGLGAEAEKRALASGMERLVLVHEPDGKLAVLEGLVRQHRPDALFVDQMHNLKASGENRTLALGEIAREIRRMANTYALVAFSMTQAGDKADDKLELRMSDIDWSNTSVQAACDLILGIGSNPQYRAAKRRMLNGLKNKLGKRDFRFPMFLEPDYNAYLSKPRRK